MANDELITKQVAQAKKFQDFLTLLSPKNQEKVIKAATLEEFAQVSETSPEKALELFEARDAYFSNPMLKPAEDKGPKKDSGEKREKDNRHAQHSGHPAEEPEGSEESKLTEEGSGEEKTSQNKPEETERNKPRTRFEQMEEAGKAVSEQSAGDESWGEPEKMETPQVPKTTSSYAPPPKTPSGWQSPPPALARPAISRLAPRSRFEMMQKAGRTISPPIPKIPKLGIKKKIKRRALLWLASFALPVIVAILPFLLILIVFVVIIGAAFSDPLGFGAQIGLGAILNPPGPTENPNPSPGPNPGSFPLPACGQVWNGLRQDFGVSVFSGDSNNYYNSDSSENCFVLQVIYRTYSIASRSGKYYSLLRGAGPFKIRIYEQSEESCSGDVLTPNNIKAHINPRYCLPVSGPSMLFLHETGHQIRQQTQPLIFSDSRLRTLRSLDPTCYNSYGFIKTYSLTTTIPASESMAESNMLYVVNAKTNVTGNGRPIYNFKSECRDTYNYIGNAVFGGYEFN